MIEINLLPEKLRKKKKPFKMPEITVASMPILIGIVTLLVIIHLAFIFTVKIQNRAYERMSKEWKVDSVKKDAIELTRRENIRMKKKVSEIEKLMSKKILWSKKLNQLSDLIMPGVWYTRLSIDKKTVVVEPKGAGPLKKKSLGMKRLATERVEISYLNIEGEVSSAYGDELAIIGRFIEQLKSAPEFFGDFSNIELHSTELHSIGKIDVMKFNINCYFKKGEKDERS